MASPGSPFRSELEHLQEQLRRSEERLRDAESKADVLEREKIWLKKEIARGRRPVTWAAAAVVALLVMGLAALFALSRVEVSKAKAFADATQMRCDAEERRNREQREQLTTELESCQNTLTRLPAPAPNARNPSCNCQPGDPLCACLDRDGALPFNRGAAGASLGRSDNGLAECLRPWRPVTFHVTVTFEPQGRLSSAHVDADSTNSLTQLEKTCIGDRLKSSVSIPPFSGAPVRVGKSYSIGGAQ